MMSAIDAALSSLVRLRGVRAAMLASESDGLAASSSSVVGVEEDALAAFATALLRRSRLASDAAGYGAAQFLSLDAEGGRLLIAARGDLALVVLAEADASAGMLRMAMQRAIGAVA